MFQEFLEHPAHYERMKRLYAQFMGAGDVVFDVGANIGTRTHIFSELGARVIAVEPQKECVRQLYIRFHDNPRVTIIPRALGAVPGEAEMQIANFTQIGTLNPAFVQMMSQRKRFEHFKWEETRTVQVTTLDALIEQFGIPAFVKIDVETYEDRVIAGLSRSVPACAFEFQPHLIRVALACIEQLEQLGGARYNYYLEEEMKLRLDEWISAEEMRQLLKSFEYTEQFRMGEVYARMKVLPAGNAGHVE